MLKIQDLHAGYGKAEVLFGVSLDVGEGEVVALAGRNGMGKTTTLRTLLGVIPATSGAILFCGERIGGLASHDIVRRGIAYVPEGRQIFAGLNVHENLLVSKARSGCGNWRIDNIYSLFPALEKRRMNPGLTLSGGEQQMLAIGRALMTQPKLLVLDEATEGLAPLVRLQIWDVLQKLKAMGQAILVVDKHLASMVKLADRHYVIEKGRIVWSGTSEQMLQESRANAAPLGI
jgi:branched-chain amino acid transport system ATP-binding protein